MEEVLKLIENDISHYEEMAKMQAFSDSFIGESIFRAKVDALEKLKEEILGM